MKKAILPFIVGVLITTGGLMLATKMSGCACSPICLCSQCNCHK